MVIDYEGALVGEAGAREPFAGGEGRDQLVELGSGNLIEGFEQALTGRVPGERPHAGARPSPRTTTAASSPAGRPPSR